MTDATPTEAHVALNLGDVQKSLRELWADEALSDAPIVRAETHNLIIVGSPDADVDIDAEAMDLALTHPGRVIAVETGPGEPMLAADASVFCRMEGDKQVCGEMITVQAHGMARDDAHSTIASLLLPDLPVYVWWQGVPPDDDHLFDEIKAIAHRFYFDSNAFPSPENGLSAMAELSGFQVSDLNWFRLNGWRQMMAQLYDVPAVRDAMRKLRSIDVHFVANTEPYNANRALLLIGWLADRLGWTLDEAKIGKTGGYIFRFAAEDGFVKAEIVEGHASNLSKGDLTGIFLVTGSVAPYVMPRIVLGEHHDCLEMRVDETLEASKKLPVHVIAHQPTKATTLLAEALLAGRDPDLQGALRVAGQLLAAVG